MLELAGPFADYVSKHGIKFSYDPSDRQFKPSKDLSNYDAIYITPFDSELSSIGMKYRGIKEPDQDAKYLDKMVYQSIKSHVISSFIPADKDSKLVEATKIALGYPKDKPLDIIVSQQLLDSDHAGTYGFLSLLFDKKELYTGKEYNPYLLSVKRLNGEVVKVTSREGNNQFFDINGCPLILLPNNDKRVKRYSSVSYIYGKGKIITDSLPWYKLGLVIENFLDKKIAENATIQADRSTEEEFVKYLYNNLE